MAEEQFTPSPTEVTQATKIRASNMNQVLEGIRDLATKKISDFPTSTPTSSDYLLFEHENEEKNTTIKDVVNTCSLTYEEIMASTDLTDLTGKVASASALKHLRPQVNGKILRFTSSTTLSYIEGTYVTIPANCIFGITARLQYNNSMPLAVMISSANSGTYPEVLSYIDHNDNNGMLGCSLSSYTINETTYYVWGKYNSSSVNEVFINFWYIQL